MVHIERTPLKKILRAVVYRNTKKLPLSEIVEREKPDLAMTGVFLSLIHILLWRSVVRYSMPVRMGGCSHSNGIQTAGLDDEGYRCLNIRHPHSPASALPILDRTA